MLIEQAFYNVLAAHAGLSALVGPRIYPLILPQNPILPAATYARVSGPAEYTGGASSQLVESRLQVSCWAPDYTTAKAVAAQVRAALSALGGTIGGASGVYVAGSWIENEIDVYEPDARLYHVVVDVRMQHE